MIKIAIYDTNLTDAQWAYHQPLQPKPAKRRRPPKNSRRISDARWRGGFTMPAKRIKGRKRHLLVDTLGLVFGLAVTPADITECAWAQLLLGRVLDWFTWLRILWVDGGYTGESFARWVKKFRPKLAVEVIKLSDQTSGFKVLSRRWMSSTPPDG